jgi:NCS1 family nucleobase:cation symporter-1
MERRERKMSELVPDPRYWNADMAPVPLANRRWGVRDMAVLWISMAACIPTYMLASSLISEGMNWWQAVLTIFLGNVVVLIPMVLNAHAGTKYGIPFPVYCRASFGLLGANIPALLRAFVACGWFGIQAWIGGTAVYTIAGVFVPEWQHLPKIAWLGINPAQLGCFLAFWAVNVFVIVRGIESIRVLLNIKAPLLIAFGLLLLGWAYHAAGGFGEMLGQPSFVQPSTKPDATFWVAFAAGLTANISFWATLSLNIPDFSRYARTQRDQALGQIVGLPTTMALYAFIGVAVTSAAFVIYPNEDREELWKPIFLLNKFENKPVLIFSMLAICLATLATNIAANVVSPANDFAHLWPSRIGFRTGGVITAVIGVLIMPWKLLADPSGYIFTWLLGISVLLGSVGGVLIADYIVIQRTRIDLAGLYRREGPYWYANGFNPIAMIALIAGIAPCVPGFLAKVDLIKVDGIWATIYTYAWFVSFGVSFVMYGVGMKLKGSSSSIE